MKTIRLSLQQARRNHYIYWGRFKFIDAKYLPIRFRSNQHSNKNRFLIYGQI